MFGTSGQQLTKCLQVFREVINAVQVHLGDLFSPKVFVLSLKKYLKDFNEEVSNMQTLRIHL